MCDHRSDAAHGTARAIRDVAQCAGAQAPPKEDVHVPLVVRELRQRRDVLLMREQAITRQLDTITELLRALEG